MKTKTFSSEQVLRNLATLTLTFLLTLQVASGQWLAGWSYRVPVVIDNSAGSALTDYQVRVSLGSFPWTHVKSDGSDIRFTSGNGTTSIPFWIETWNYSTSAEIWVRVPSIGAGTTATVYLYYGNASAGSASNGVNTFDFFEDFGQGSIDYSKWVRTGTPTLSVVTDNGNYALRVVAPGQHFYYLASINRTFTDFVFETRVKMQADLNNQCTPEIAFRYTDNSNNYITMLRGEGLVGGGGPNGDLFIRRYQGGVATNPSSYPAYNYTADRYYKYKIVASQDMIQQHLDGTLVRTWTDTGSGIDQGGIGLGNYGNNSYAVYYDDVFIRKYTSIEPGATLGTEENQFPPLNVTGVVTNVSCHEGFDGSIDITVTGGDGTYTYLWSNGGTSEDISSLSAGIYTVNVEDGNGPVGEATFEVSQPSAIVPEVTITSPLVCGGGTATLVISASGGTPPYSSGTGEFQQAAGTVDYTITDDNGCQVTFPVTVSLPGAWFNTSWLYRKPVEIANPAGSELSDFQVKVVLDNSFDFENASQEASDLRFTTENGTEIPYWIENWDYSGEQAVIWVKVPVIPAEGTLLYLYYGNSSALAASDGSATFMLFDDFSAGSSGSGYWSSSVAHDWKYSMEMQQGALYYAIERAAQGWSTESLDTEIAGELNYMHTQINPDGSVIPDSYLTGEPQYCYGVIMSNLALGYLYFNGRNPSLATQCYNDLSLVFDRLLSTYPTVASLSDAGGYGMLLHGFSNAWKAFNGNDATRTVQAGSIVQSYTATFIANQTAGGAWTGAAGVQEHLKRDFGVLLAYDVTADASYLAAVSSNIGYIINSFWLSANGGLEWYESAGSSDRFFECHQQWFMIAVRLLYNKSGGAYNYLTQGLAAWHFLTDNNFAGIDMYVHNFVNHSAFFSYRDVQQDGSFQDVDLWKGSYELGSALWGMSLNYAWVSAYQSAHSGQPYNYLDELVKQAKKLTDQDGFYTSSGNWARRLNWTQLSYQPDESIWDRIGSPTVQLVQVNGNNALSIVGNGHDNHYVTDDKSFDNFVFEASVMMTEDQNSYSDPEVGFHYIDLNNRYFTQMRGTGINDLFLRRYQGGTQYINSSSPYDYTQDVYMKYSMIINGNSIRLLINDAVVTDYLDNGTLLSGGVYLGNYGSYPVYYDDVRIRKYVAVEPVVTISDEEAAFTWTGCENSSVWATGGNWYSGIAPGSAADVRILPADFYPVIAEEIECATLTIEPGARLTINTGGTLTAGTLTINSTGTANSGSLVNMGTVNGTLVFNRPLLAQNAGGDFQLVASPVLSNADPNTEDIVRAKAWNEVTGLWSNGLITDVVNGRGYNLKQTTSGDGIVTFRGQLPADNTIEIDATCPFIGAYDGTLAGYNTRTYVSNTSSNSGTPRDGGDYWGGGGWNLLGNPFASALNVGEFIDYNNGTSWTDSQFDPSYVALYIHDGSAGSYKYVSNSTGWEGGDYLDQPDIPAGQGFFVLAMDDLSTFTFTRDMQVHDATVPMLKSTGDDNRWPGLQLKVKLGTAEKSTLIVYGDGMSPNLDPGFDVGQFGATAGINIYTTLSGQDNGVNFSRQALPVNDPGANKIPVGVDTETGGEVTFSAVTRQVGTNRFWLEDRLTGIYTDLTAKSYTVTLPADNYGTGRFFIIASVNTPTRTEKPSEEESGLRIWTSGGKVIIKGQVSEEANCVIFDMNGNRVIERVLEDQIINTLDVPSGLRGVFFIRVTDGLKVTNKKVVIL